MNHSFNVEIATEYGIPCALLLEHILYWVTVNAKKGANRYNGRYWMYKTVAEFSATYPYLTRKQVRRAIEKLKANELVITVDFGKKQYGGALWYTVTRKGKMLFSKYGITPENQPTPLAPQGEPLAPQGEPFAPQGISSYIYCRKGIEESIEKVVEEGGGSSRETEPNPFGEAATAASPALDPLVAYAQNNLMHLGPYNMDELISFRDALPDEVIQHAIDEACAAGVRRYKYVKSILNRYVEQGFKSVAEVEAQEEQRMKDNGRRHDATSGEYAAPEDVFG